METLSFKRGKQEKERERENHMEKILKEEKVVGEGKNVYSAL